MVRITKLELKNFKSFRKANIPFADGFTTIAGANGTGKSNILDGLLFALGITSMKLLRADKITELVNHEAEDDIARATLFLKGKGEEFEISRTIDKQGKSVCRLNQKRCGLNEIASFLNEVGIKPTGYNIVVQGDITRIIQMSPKERRGIIDEAAGIREFDEKREEALKELEKVEGKIKEVRIVLNEREQFLQELALERESASKYLQATRELKQSKATLLSLEVSELKADNAKIEAKENNIAAELKHFTEQRNIASEKISEFNAKIEELNNQLIQASEKAFEGIGRTLEEKKAEARIAEEKAKSIKEGIAFENARIAKIRQAEKELLEGKNVLEKEIQIAEKNLGEVSERLQLLEAEKVNEGLHESIKKHSALENEAKSLSESLKELKKAVAKCPVCEAKLSESRKKELAEGREKQIQSLKEKTQSLSKKIRELEQKSLLLQDLRNAIHEKGSEKFRLGLESKSTAEKSAELRKERVEIEKRIIENTEKAALEEGRISQLQSELKELELEQKKFSEKNKRLLSEKELSKAKLEESIGKKQKLEESVRKTEQQLNELALEKSKNNVRLADFQEELKEFSEERIIENVSLNALRQRIPQLEKEISSLGAVNMKALESFETLEKEVWEVRQKANKLEEERIAVLDLIQKIEVKRLEVFTNCFNKVNENFNRIYYQFFEGRGELRLTDDRNPFEAGLIIEAKHKSDKALSIDLMSGGEKTLAALAFLFAIQLFEPSPFYVFDEADAALDEENSVKFARMVKEISSDSQFIAITHNDIVIKQADQVIGVALNQQKSSVIGLKLKEEIKNN